MTDTAAAPDSLKSILPTLGVYGDMFGALTCLFTGAAIIGARYAVILQNRQLKHQQEEIEKADRRHEAADTARKQESRANAEWERQTAMLNATSFVAQALAAKLAAIPAEIISHADHERLADRKKARADIQEQLDQSIEVLSNILEGMSKEHLHTLRTPSEG